MCEPRVGNERSVGVCCESITQPRIVVPGVQLIGRVFAQVIFPELERIFRALRGARERIARGWTQGATARVEAWGLVVVPQSPQATCWCAVGALESATRYLSDAGDALMALRKVLPRGKWGRDVSHFNDAPSTTQADVLALFDRAIAAEEARAAR